MLRSSILAASLTLGTIACGRSPVFQPCAERLDETAVLTCDPTQICEAPSFSITNRTANALIMLDRSCSMASLVDGRSKWSRAVHAVTDVVSEPRANLNWGLSVFPDTGPTECMQGPTAVPVGPGQEGRIERLLDRALDRDDPYHPQEPCGTNLAGATQQVRDEQPFATLLGRHHIVLISDGRHAGCAGSSDDAIDNIAALREQDVRTIVVGFGGSEDTDVLQAMGEAGGVPASPELAYHLAGLDELGNVLEQVAQGMGCRHPLVIDAPLNRVRVTFDGSREVPRNLGLGEGWHHAQDVLTFSGESCQQLLRGDVEIIEIALDCD